MSDGLNGNDRALLVKVAGACERIEGRLGEIRRAQERDVRALHHRVTEVREEANQDVREAEARLSKEMDDVRSDVRQPAARWGGGAGAVAAAAISVMWDALKGAVLGR